MVLDGEDNFTFADEPQSLPLNDRQTDIVIIAGHAAGNILAKNQDCGRYVTGGRKDALKRFGKALKATRFDPNLSTDFPAETDPGVGGTIRLGKNFFNLALQDVSLSGQFRELLGMDVTKELGSRERQRAFILLHEFQHSATGKEHKTLDEYKQWLKDLYEICFKPK